MNYYVDVPVRIFGGKVAERWTFDGVISEYRIRKLQISFWAILSDIPKDGIVT